MDTDYLMSNNNRDAQFDTLAALYDDMATWPFRKEIEIPAVLEKIGNVSNMDIFDFGCGSGHYSRLLKSKGAKRVVGFDIAGGMLDHAREREIRVPQGVEYTSTLEGFEKKFDLVLGVYVLPYADNREKLQSMVNSMVRLLRPGGRLLTLPLNPEYAVDHDYYAPYGFRLMTDTPYQEGSEVYLHLPIGDQDIKITAWYWSRSSLNQSLEDAGLADIQWHAPRLTESQPSMNLDAYLEQPHTMLVDSRYLSD
jgi:SAM-dependent methyltransferase